MSVQPRARPRQKACPRFGKGFTGASPTTRVPQRSLAGEIGGSINRPGRSLSAARCITLRTWARAMPS